MASPPEASTSNLSRVVSPLAPPPSLSASPPPKTGSREPPRNAVVPAADSTSPRMHSLPPTPSDRRRESRRSLQPSPLPTIPSSSVLPSSFKSSAHSSADAYASAPTSGVFTPLNASSPVLVPNPKSLSTVTGGNPDHAGLLSAPSPIPPAHATYASRPLSPAANPSDPYALYALPTQTSSSLAFSASDRDADSQRAIVAAGQTPAMGTRSPSGLSSYWANGAAPKDGAEDEKDAEKNAAVAKSGRWERTSSKGKKWLVCGLLAVVIVVAVATAVPISLSKQKHAPVFAAATTQAGPTTTMSAPIGVPTGGSNGTDWRTAATGGDGSVVYAAEGSFIYNNTFGGFWNSIPFNDSAQAQSDVPPLNQRWDYSTDMISGVNLGGWLVLEPFISPALFEPFNSPTNDPTAANGAVDEWTLSLALGPNMSAVITEHYATFITEKDFAEIAAAGLNWVRIPVPYWIVEVLPGEPFLANVGWTYFLKAIEWARKYGLRVNLDLHAVPGSQNGYNHSSKLGTLNFLNGVMGIVNAQRTLNYIRTLTEFISQPQYSNVIPMFSILNEPLANVIGVDVLRNFYLEVYEMTRAITGVGEGEGPWIAFHDGFVAQSTPVSEGGWDGFLTGADRISIDSHPYLCFDAPNNDPLAFQASKPCSYWAPKVNTSSEQFGLSIAGEWSLAINDCGKWINNVGNGARFDGTYYAPGTTTLEFKAAGSCDVWNDWEDYTPAIKAGLQQVAEGHMDALQHWFFWTWKTGYSSTLGRVANPLWNYQLGLQQGYIPANPRLARNTCPSLLAAAGVSVSQNSAPPLSAWMTGGVGAGTIIPTDQLTSYGAWPPLSLGATPAANLPTFTATGAVITMAPAARPTSFPAGYSSSVNVGSGWADKADTGGWAVSVDGCAYPDAWSGVLATIPTAACTGSSLGRRMKRAVSPMITPPPSMKR